MFVVDYTGDWSTAYLAELVSLQLLRGRFTRLTVKFPFVAVILLLLSFNNGVHF